MFRYAILPSFKYINIKFLSLLWQITLGKNVVDNLLLISHILYNRRNIYIYIYRCRFSNHIFHFAVTVLIYDRGCYHWLYINIFGLCASIFSFQLIENSENSAPCPQCYITPKYTYRIRCFEGPIFLHPQPKSTSSSKLWTKPKESICLLYISC